nr:hypothetical protein [Flavobacterium sp. NKUCC04_CG]
MFRPVLPALEYVVFYDYIKNELCVNKDKPKMDCNGKCHLKKELAKTAESDNNKDKQHTFSLEKNLTYYTEISWELPRYIKIKSNLKPLFTYDNRYHFSFATFVFRPPLYP